MTPRTAPDCVTAIVGALLILTEYGCFADRPFASVT
jgi:hypothetical protein